MKRGLVQLQWASAGERQPQLAMVGAAPQHRRPRPARPAATRAHALECRLRGGRQSLLAGGRVGRLPHALVRTNKLSNGKMTG